MAELLSRHWDTAVLLAGRVLGSPDLARDAVQEAAIAAMTDLERLRSPDRFGAWFCGIALNVSRRWLRQLRSEMPGLPLDMASGSPDPAEAAEVVDTAARVRGAIAALAPKLVQFKPTPEVSTVSATAAVEWAEVSVSEIRRTQAEDILQRKHVMILAERDGARRLPVWIGPAEATTLALTLESVETPRPFTYKLALGLVEASGSQVTEVRITRLLDSVFYACVVVQGPTGLREVDARPSDAVNLAVACGAPIRLNSELFSLELEADYAEKQSSYLVATAAIVAETQRQMQEAREEIARRRA